MKRKNCLHLLAFDLGAESVRVIIGHFDGRQLKVEEIHRIPNSPIRVGNNLYSDVLHIWSELQNGLQKAGAQYGMALTSVGVDTWGVDCALLDVNDRLITNPYHYRDRRTDGMIEVAFSRVPCEEIYSYTGNLFVQYNTLYQLLAFVQQEKPLLDAAHSLLMLPDLFHFWLSGEKVSEFSIATTSQCYDPVHHDWAWDLLKRLDIPLHLFQRVVPSGTVIGKLHGWLAKQSDCGEIPVVAPVCHDTGSAVASIPVRTPHYMYISSGTWSLVGVELEKPMITAEALANNLTNEGGIGNQTRFLKIVPGMWLLQQCRSEWARRGRLYTYDELTAMAVEAPAFGPLVWVAAPDFLDPGDMPARIQAYCQKTGQRIPQTEGEIVRCVLESLACQYRGLLLVLENLLGKHLEVIHIIGGGSRNRLLNQMTADATNRLVIAGPVEATATGNLLVQAMGLGHLSSLEDLRQVVRDSFELEFFTPENSSPWEECCQRYSELKGTGKQNG